MRGLWSRLRAGTVASTVLVVVGTLLILVGLVAAYARDTLLTPERFAGVAVAASERPEVRAELRRVIVDQLIAQRPALIAARPLLEGAVDTVLGSTAFRRILIAAAIETHRTLATDESTILLDLTDATTVVIGTLRAFAPDLAAAIPPQVETGLIAIGDRPFTQGFQTAEATVTWLLVAGLGLGLLAYGVALARAANRRRVAASIGVALAVGALLGQLGLGIGRTVFLGRLASPATRLAAGAVWDTAAAELASWLWLAAGAGTLLAAIATAAPHLLAPRPRLATLRRLATLPASPAWRARYAIGGTAGGLLLLAAPELAVSLLARALGLLLLYIAVTELLRLSGGEDRPTERQHTRRDTRRDPTRPLAALALAALVIGGGAVVWANRDALRTDSVAAAAAIDRCNGHSELCDRPLDQVAFAATHNAMAAAREPGWYLAAHEAGIRQQLHDGIRAFLIDAHYGFPGTNGVATDESNPNRRTLIEAGLSTETIDAAQRLAASRLAGRIPGAPRETYLCHGFCELGATPLDVAARWLADFLAANPNEVLILFIEDYVAPDDVAAAFTRGQLIDELYTHEASAPWPTLRQLIERRQRVVVLAENAADQVRPAWYHDGWVLAQDTSYSYARPTDFDCAPNRGVVDAPLFLLNHWVARQPPDPGDAAIVNTYEFLLARARQCQQERGRLPNLIAVDFYQIGDLLRVVDELNNIHAP